jgi:hypothetical protein
VLIAKTLRYRTAFALAVVFMMEEKLLMWLLETKVL